MYVSITRQPLIELRFIRKYHRICLQFKIDFLDYKLGNEEMRSMRA